MAHDTTWPQRRKWSTTFYLNAANAAAAAAALVSAYVANLRPATDQTIFAYEVYATSALEGDDDYTVVSVPPSQQRGTLAVGSRGELYLTKAVVTTDLRAVAGRPSRKFWRMGLREGDVVSGAELQGYAVAEVQEAFDNFIIQLDGVLVDPDGQAINAVGKIRLSTREFGRTAGADVPAPPVG